MTDQLAGDRRVPDALAADKPAVGPLAADTLDPDPAGDTPVRDALAVAVGYAARTSVPVGARIAVFDFGGRSCDATVLERTAAGFSALASKGAAHPAGSDFDEALFRLVLGRLGERGRDLLEEGRAAIRQACVRARGQLSSQPSVALEVPGSAQPVAVSRTEFESLIRGDVRDGLELLASAIQASAGPADELQVIGTGECCHIPLVGAMLAKAYPGRVVITDQPAPATAAPPIASEVTPGSKPTPTPDFGPSRQGGRFDGDYAVKSSTLSGSVPPMEPYSDQAEITTVLTAPPTMPLPVTAATAPLPVPAHDAPTEQLPLPPTEPPETPMSPHLIFDHFPDVTVEEDPDSWPQEAGTPASAGYAAAASAVPTSAVPGYAAPQSATSPYGPNQRPPGQPSPPPGPYAPQPQYPQQPYPPQQYPPQGQRPTGSPPSGPPGVPPQHRPSPSYRPPTQPGRPGGPHGPGGYGPGGPPGPGGFDDGSGSKKKLILIIAAAVVALGAVVTAAVLFFRPDPPTAAPAPTTIVVPSAAPSESQSAGTPASTATPTGPSSPDPLRELPKAAPLPPNIVVVPMRRESGSTRPLHLVDADGGIDPDELAEGPDAPNSNPMMQPSRDTIIYVSEGVFRVMASDGSADKELLDRLPAGCDDVEHAAWSQADPSQFVITCRLTKSKTSLMVVSLDGKLVRRLDTGKSVVGDFGLSADGQTVAYWASNNRNLDGGAIFSLPLVGTGSPKQLTKSADGVDAHPAWSPDGTQIAFRRKLNNGTAKGNDNVFVMNSDGSGVRAVATTPAADFKPIWSPDGKNLLIISNRKSAFGGAGSTYDLWLTRVSDGEVLQQLGLKAKSITRPFWTLR